MPVVDLYVSGLPEGGPVDVNAVRAAVPVAQRPHLDLDELHRALTGGAPLPHCVLSTPDPVEVARVEGALRAAGVDCALVERGARLGDLRQLVRESVGALFSRSDAVPPSGGARHPLQGERRRQAPVTGRGRRAEARDHRRGRVGGGGPPGGVGVVGQHAGGSGRLRARR